MKHKTIEEQEKEVDRMLEEAFNAAVSACLSQVRGEVSEEQRDALLKDLDVHCKNKLRTALKEAEARGAARGAARGRKERDGEWQDAIGTVVEYWRAHGSVFDEMGHEIVNEALQERDALDTRHYKDK